MIGSLMYLTASRPDIQFSICLCVRYQANPKESHLVAIKRIFKYLKGTPNLGLWYPKGLGFDLKAYSDLDYDGCNLDRKSTLGGCQILGGKLVQVPMLCDNTSAIVISNNPVLHSKTKHIDIRDFWYSTKVVDNTITFSLSNVKKLLSFNQDIFTSVIGLEYSKDYISLPDHETVKDVIVALGLSDEKELEKTLEDLAHSSLLRLRFFSPTWKVPLTFYMRKIAKLSEEPLIIPSEEVNIEATGDMSLSETSEHPVSKPKSKTNKKQKTKKNPSSSKLSASKDHDGDESMHSKQHDVTLESLTKIAKESPFDIESEILLSKDINQMKRLAEITSLSNKVDQLESSITKKVSEEIHTFVPLLASPALKETLPNLLDDALKDTLPTLLHEFVKTIVHESMGEKSSLFQA
ncbi:hypothetical protein Tco_1073780 [Tanacetum coccineum]